MKKLSIIMPVFNEEGTIDPTISRVAEMVVAGYQKEIIVVDDGSTDSTPKLLEKLRRKFNFLLLGHSKNLGKGAAIKSALKQTSGDLILIQDADLEYDPKDWPNLINALDESCSVVYGSRNLGEGQRGYFLYYLGGRFITAFLNLLLGSKLTDVNTGYKLFRAGILKRIDLQSNGFEFCEEVTAKILKSGYTIREVPIHYYPRKFSEGKKIRFVHGLISL